MLCSAFIGSFHLLQQADNFSAFGGRESRWYKNLSVSHRFGGVATCSQKKKLVFFPIFPYQFPQTMSKNSGGPVIRWWQLQRQPGRVHGSIHPAPNDKNEQKNPD